MLWGRLVWGQFVDWIGEGKAKRQGSSQETPAVVQEGGDQGLNWERETVEMEKYGHMGEIIKA